ncbi:MAG: SH3 domain-containing protein [Anaerolineae bacterium]
MLWRLFLPFLLVLPAMIACGGFQIRVTPAASPSPQANRPAATVTRPAVVTPTATPAPTRPPTVAPTATPTPAGLAPGKSARVTASGGVNMRDKPSSSAKLLGRLAPNTVVSVKEGPTDAEGFTWWLVDDGAGHVGWVAAGTADDPWLSVEKGSGAAVGGGKLVNRPVRLGDRVQVTTQEGKMLTIREAAGVTSPPVARVLPGTQLTVRGGPVRQDGYLWWQVEGEQVKGWAAEGEEGDRWLTPVED